MAILKLREMVARKPGEKPFVPDETEPDVSEPGLTGQVTSVLVELPDGPASNGSEQSTVTQKSGRICTIKMFFDEILDLTVIRCVLC